MSRNCLVYVCDRPVPYVQAWRWQQELVGLAQADASRADQLLILEHPAVYTLGQGASWEFVRFDPHHHLEWHRIERGGEVTHHNLGQVVAYPIFNLRHHRQDLHWYLRQLEEVIILSLRDFGLQAERLPGYTGVWLAGKKVAQIGIKVSKWITMHGLAINVDMDMAGFDLIVPCGISDRQVGQIKEFKPEITLKLLIPSLIQAFSHVFHLHCLVDSQYNPRNK